MVVTLLNSSAVYMIYLNGYVNRCCMQAVSGAKINIHQHNVQKVPSIRS